MSTHAAELFVITATSVERYRTAWHAAQLTRELLSGPACTTAFVRAQHPMTADVPLLDTDHVGGAVLIDLVRRELHWFGAGEARDDVSFRRHVLRAVSGAWKGWHVHWCGEGIGGLAQRVGYPIDIPREVPEARPLDELLNTATSDWVSCPVTVRHPNGQNVVLHTCWKRPADVLLRSGTAWVDEAIHRLGRRTSHDQGSPPPTGGVHIDVAARTLSVWQAAPIWNAANRLRDLDGAWQVQWWADNYQTHLTAAQGTLSWSFASPRLLTTRLHRSILADLHTAGDDRVCLALDAIRRVSRPDAHDNRFRVVQ
jgi:hypothetical protein